MGETVLKIRCGEILNKLEDSDSFTDFLPPIGSIINYKFFQAETIRYKVIGYEFFTEAYYNGSYIGKSVIVDVERI